MTVAEWAAKLNGREYTEEMTRTEEELAKVDGVAIVFGASDDLMEFRGAIEDEASAYNGATVQLDIDGILPSWDEVRDNGGESFAETYFARKAKYRTITALWAPSDETTGVAWASWAYETLIPHATFDIMEDGELYCRGIAFAMSDLT